MLLLTFSKTGQEDIVLTEDDLFDFNYEANAYSGEAFELGGVCAKSIYLIIDNNTQRFSRGTFANSRIKLEIDGHFYGYFNAELPKRRNGVIELTAYDDMVKLDVEFPSDVIFPSLFKQTYVYCAIAAGLAQEFSLDNVVLNGVWDNGIVTYEYTDYIYANSCRNLVSGMAEWNGGFVHINDDGKLQVDKFSKTVSREYSSGDMMELDYSDETVVFRKVKVSQKNKTYEMGDDSGYTLTLKNQYISSGLDDTAFETYLTFIYEYYNGFSLTPMSFTFAEPDFELNIGDRIQVYDEEEQVTITGNVSKIEISGNCSMKVTCGGFENVSSSNNFTPTSYSQISQAKTEAAQTGGRAAGSVLTEYKYLTDLSVRFNGTTYTAEKDSATGLISRISDDAGNEFEPTISGGISDVAMHNAAFLAVAMLSGLGNSTIMPVTAGLVGYFDYKRQCAPALWTNRLGGENIPITGSAAVSADCLEMPNQTYGMFKLPYQGNGDLVVYAVVKTSINQSTQWYEQDTVIGSSYQLVASYWRSICVNGFVDAGERYRTWWVDKFDNGITGGINGVYTKSHEQYHILTLTQNNGLLCFYIDGVLTDDTIKLSERYGDYWGINCLANNTGGIQYFQKAKYSGMTAYLKMLAFGRTPHTAEQIATNAAWLKKYYGL